MKVTTATVGLAPVERPSFAAAASAARAYEASRKDTLSTPHQEALREIARRLDRLTVQFEDLMAVNEKLMTASGLSLQFDPSTDSITLRVGDVEQHIQLNRADPKVPIEMKSLTQGGAYLAGSGEDALAGDPELRLTLEIGLESFYQSAHRVLKLFGMIDELRRIRCLPVTQVRNNLIEHPEDDQFYSFGFGSTGPRVKPMHRGEPVWNDEGLLPNAAAFVTAIISGVSGATDESVRT